MSPSDKLTVAKAKLKIHVPIEDFAFATLHQIPSCLALSYVGLSV